MKIMEIEGNRELSGTIRISGAKNATVALIPAAILTDEEVIEIIHSDKNLEQKYPYRYLSEKDTIVRIKER